MRNKPNLAAYAGHHKGKRYPAETLTPDEVERLLRATNRGATGARNRALIAVMYRAGLRISEALKLMPKDVDAGAGMLRVLHGKTSRFHTIEARVVGIDRGALDAVQVWMATREKLGINGRHPLFCLLDGRPMSGNAVREMLGRVASKAGIDKRVHPHIFRHTHAFELSMEGVPVNIIQQQLGHRSLAVTDRYLRHLAPEQVVDAIHSRTWSMPQ